MVTDIEERVTKLERRVSSEASEPSIVNVDLTVSNQEYEHQFPVGCKKFCLQLRDATDLRVATRQHGTETAVAQYFTLKANAVMWDDHLNIKDPGEAVLYLAATGGAKVVEIMQWS